MSINLEAAISGFLDTIDNRKTIQIYQYAGQTNVKGTITVNYTGPISSIAHVQLENTQNLQHIEGLNLTSIYKRFYIDLTNTTGLNRNIGTGGDYIICEGLKYKIIEVTEQFNNDHVTVIGVEQAIV